MTDTETRWEVRSEELRRNLRPLLNSIEREHAHVTVKRYDEPVAVLVPADWYDTVIAYIAATTFTKEAADFYARQKASLRDASDAGTANRAISTALEDAKEGEQQ